MKPLICPQCGGKITDYKPWDNFVVCGYCETKTVINTEKPQPIPQPPPPFSEPVNKPFQATSNPWGLIIAVISVLFLYVFGMVALTVLNSNTNKPNYAVQTPTPYKYVSPTPKAIFSPTPVNNPNLLDFGGTGTSIGAFHNACTIAVDKEGNIFVGDEALRVQKFDNKGNFLKLWQIPKETRNYKRARQIDKIAVHDDGRMFVAVGGVILIYRQDNEEHDQTIHFAPDYIVDFAIRSDGSILAVSSDDQIETLRFINKLNRQLRSLEAFHTDASDQPIAPVEIGLASIRIAVDGAGNIFSVYALGDLGSYSVSMNSANLQIFRFSPEGKFTDKFAQSQHSVGIALDSQSRVYVSDRTTVSLHTKDGNPLGAATTVKGIRAFALDRQNNLYIVHENRVIKRAAIE